MISKRILLAGVALVLAVVAGVASYSYLHDVQNRAYHNAQLVKVYKVSEPIPAGTPGATAISRGLIKQGQIPQQFLPSDVVTDLASIRSEVAVANLAPGQIVESGVFVSPQAAVASASQAVPKGDVAITVSVDQVHGVAGLVHPGDMVDILIETTGGVEQFLYQNVDVLAVGSTITQGASVTAANGSTATTTPPSSSGLITFAVPAQAAARIALAQSGGGGVTGSLYLALVPPGNKASTQAPINQANLIPASVTP